MKKLSLLLTSSMILAGMASSVNAGELAGNTEGAQIIRVEKTRGRIDALNDIVYSQVKAPSPFVNCICLCWCRVTAI